MAEETVIIRFQGDASSVETAADAASRAVEGVEKTTKTAGKGFDALGTIATGAFHAIGEAAVNIAGSALSKLGDFVAGSIKEAAEFQSIFAQTEAVVKSTGEAAGLTAKEMAGMAEAMSASSGMSLFADDAILGAQNVLATFTQIRGENFGGATQSIIDMSQALGTDLQSSAMQVGKALNDPVAGVSALGRAGVQFTDDQKAMIKSMVETGNVAGAQGIILGELETQFGGSAAAAVDTFAGQQIILAEQFANVQQTLGEALMPVLMRFGAFAQETLVPVVEDIIAVFVEWIDSVDWPAVMSAIGGVTDALYDFIYGTDWQGGLDEIQGGLDTFKTAIAPITSAIAALWAVAQPALTALYNVIATQLASPATQAQIAGIVSIFKLLGDILILVVSLAVRQIAAEIGYLMQAFQFFWPYLQIVLNGWTALMAPLQTLVIGILTAISQALRGDFAGAWITVKNAAIDFVNSITNSINTFVAEVMPKITGFIATLGTEAMKIGTAIADGIAKGIKSAANSVINALGGIIDAAIKAAKEKLGIASPSKLFADQIGYQMSAGMAAGIVRGIPDVTGAIGVTTGAAVGAVNQTTQNYYLSASYQTAQSESSISQDLRAMQLLAGGMA